MQPNYTIGIDLGGTNIRFALINKQGKILAKEALATSDYPTKNALIEALIANIEEILSNNSLRRKGILGIGIGVAGLIDSKNGIVHCLVNIKGWKNVALSRIIEKRFNIPCFIDNDVNLMALAEFRFGAGKNSSNLVCLTLGTGVGGGIIVNKELYRGSTLSAGEIGHIPIERKGRRCNCGGNGCIEAYIGNSYLVKNVISQIKKGKSTTITKLVDNKLSRITPKIIAKAAKNGDKFAIGIWREAGHNLGIALTGIVNFFNPDKIIIGGGMAQAGKILLTSVIKTVRARAMGIPVKDIKIVKSRLGEDAGTIGAATLVMTKKGIL